ncbi:MAG: MFS transporter, partial [Duodenibacillus sp.]|nr:MFS transporter [Duodenibacillus sp.]
MTPGERSAGLGVYRDPRVLRMLFLGFSAGLPLLLVLGTLSFRLREAGIDLRTIGFMSWIGLCWGFKWAWAPLVDQAPLPWLTARLGRRRAWLLAAQLGIALSLAGMAAVDPASRLDALAALALATAFLGATQDIALDAYRIEMAPPEEQAALAASYQTGYRIAMIWSGAGALAIAAAGDARGLDGWRLAYGLMAASAFVGVAATLMSPERPCRRREPPAARRRTALAWLSECALAPFQDFFRRMGWGAAAVLALIATYRISDVVMGVMANPFYLDLGFTKQEIAAVSKVFGVLMTLAGAFLGGWITSRIGVMRALMLGGFLSAAT